MPAPPVNEPPLAVPPSPQVHPEFGYFCPAPPLRRAIRVALISLVCGATVGAAGVWTGMSVIRSNAAGPAPVAQRSPSWAGGAQAASSSSPSSSSSSSWAGGETVGRGAVLSTFAVPSDQEEDTACQQQSWPYRDSKCRSGSGFPATEGRGVRVLRPDQPEKSGTAMVVDAPTGKDATAAAASADRQQPENAAGEKKRKSARHHRARHSRHEYRNAREDYVPYRDRYMGVRRGRWDW